MRLPIRVGAHPSFSGEIVIRCGKSLQARYDRLIADIHTIAVRPKFHGLSTASLEPTDQFGLALSELDRTNRGFASFIGVEPRYHGLSQFNRKARLIFAQGNHRCSNESFGSSAIKQRENTVERRCIGVRPTVERREWIRLNGDAKKSITIVRQGSRALVITIVNFL